MWVGVEGLTWYLYLERQIWIGYRVCGIIIVKVKIVNIISTNIIIKKVHIH